MTGIAGGQLSDPLVATPPDAEALEGRRSREWTAWRDLFVRSLRLFAGGIALGAAGAGVALALGVFSHVPHFTEAMLANIEAHLDSMDTEQLMEALGTQGPFAEALRSPWTLFLHNLTVAAALVAGGFSFGVLTGVVLVVNGFAVGFLGVLALAIGLPAGVLLATVAPHGVFEVTGLCLAGAAGLMLGRYFRKRWRREPTDFGRLWWFAAAAVLALMLASAFLELYVTPGAVRLALKWR